jgi:hypothetical protein
MSTNADLYDWAQESMLEVILPSPDNFLKVKETLTRIGVASRKEKKLFQSAHILHKQGKYYIVHFKELFKLDRRESNITINDIDRRNAIACLLEDWGLVKIVGRPQVDTKAIMAQIKILSHASKGEWVLEAKYNVGKHKQQRGTK